MRVRCLALWPLVSAVTHGHEPPPPAKRVAIIGAGAGGASAAFHLAQYAVAASIPVNITVYERNAYIGGRTTTVSPWGDTTLAVELGGSIFVKANRIMVDAAERFNLSTTSPNLVAELALPELGIWNGREWLITTQAEDTWWDKAKLLWRYGAAPLWTNRLMKRAVGRFLTMYEEPVFPWASLSEAVERVGLLEATGVTGEQYLEQNGIGEAFAKEVVQASTRVNYASNLAYIHGLETMVCMATGGATSIAGGNWNIFAHMLAASGASLHLNTTVTTITRTASHAGPFTLTTAANTTAIYDDVILAAPLQFANLTIHPTPRHAPAPIPYTNLHATLFASPHRLDPAAFALPPGASLPRYILTSLPASEPPSQDSAGSPGFFAISLTRAAFNPHTQPPRREYIYKIFSPHRVNATFLSHILGHAVVEPNPEQPPSHDGPVSWIHRKLWAAYPRELPRVTFEEVQLDAGLWYTSGIEAFISTMETSALSGKNVARLVRDGWWKDQATHIHDEMPKPEQQQAKSSNDEVYQMEL